MKRFHEGPLVLFSALATAGAGILAAWPLSRATGLVGSTRTSAMVAAALLAAAMAVSLAHLGRRSRFHLALSRGGGSPLSNEVILATVTLASTLPLALGSDGIASTWWSALGAAISCAFLVSIGLVYRLPATTTWAEVTPIAPLVSGVLLGLLWHLATADAWGLRFTWPALLVVVADTALLAARARIDRRALGRAAHPAIHAWRNPLLAARFLLVDAGAVLFLQRGSPEMALISTALGLLVDRFAFYGLAVTRTIESEIERVEAVMGDAQ
jgi:DMSO reductase anchor subunit